MSREDLELMNLFNHPQGDVSKKQINEQTKKQTIKHAKDGNRGNLDKVLEAQLAMISAQYVQQSSGENTASLSNSTCEISSDNRFSNMRLYLCQDRENDGRCLHIDCNEAISRPLAFPK